MDGFEELEMTSLEMIASQAMEIFETFVNVGFEDEHAFALTLEYFGQALAAGYAEKGY